MKHALAVLVAAVLVGCSSSPPSSTPNEKMFALAGHLATTDLPTGWTLTRYSITGGSGYIDARLDFEARLEALAIVPGERFLYFSTPCPGRASPAWRLFNAHEDVFIAVNIDGRQRFMVSCRAAT